ncbi:nucleotide exchange factor GrpE [Schleiferilactobacillus perolens]|uniref:Protein GrpE n=1 Tax=Schleiferilactobacillus perolens DSM 12744 TaxID=1423792 RepID=A0A0R1MY95_9LACO|nr:heat shock protein GrpE [Schleiferilactobacillus perolens DSM 12744]
MAKEKESETKKSTFPDEKHVQDKDTAAQIHAHVAAGRDKKTNATESVEDQVLDETKADLDELLKGSGDTKLQQENKELKDKLAQTEDKYLRAEAEIRNMSARQQKEINSMLKYDGQKLAKSILPVADNLERALAAEVKAGGLDQLHKGVEMTQQHLIHSLEENHITEIKAAGEKFDPTKHQAVSTVPADNDHPAETVVQVLQKGYMLQDRVLRPAMVVVAQ